jgi:hypothetical protein
MSGEGVVAPGTTWKTTYDGYMRLQRTWPVANAPPAIASQLFRAALHGFKTPDMVAREFRGFGLAPPPAGVLDEAMRLQETLYPSHTDRPDGRRPENPLEDVFAAALSMLPHGFWVESPDREQLYRGQRNATWPTLPSLFRAKDSSCELDKLAEAVARIRAALPTLDHDQVIAVAQHYSKELDVATWLLDVTFDPRVALFFASDRGAAGDVGVVNCIVQREWTDLSADGTNRLGRLRVIDVPNVLRIERQRASFLDTSHPGLFEQYVPHSVWFKQVQGLTFEDVSAPHPVSGGVIYPSPDPTLERLLAAVPLPKEGLRMRLGRDPRDRLDGEVYWEIAQSWCDAAGVVIDPYREDTLRVVCDVHADLQGLPGAFELPERSLLRLKDAVDAVIRAQQEGKFVSPQEALRWSSNRLDPERAAVFDSIIMKSMRRRDLC